VTKFNHLHPVPCVFWKHGAYWLVKKGKWVSLGPVLETALAEYARRVQAAKEGKLPALIDTTLDHHITAEKLAPSTVEQYRDAAIVLKRKLRQFDSPRQILPRHVAKIKLDGAATPNMTNRVITVLRVLFSMYWLEQELCDINPCVGIKPHKENARKRLITNEEWWAIHAAATPRMKAIMKVAFLTGQRIGDVIKIRRSQFTEEGVSFVQTKTGAKLTVQWQPDLRQAVADALALQGPVKSVYLFLGRSQKRLAPPGYGAILAEWHRACDAAGIEDARPNDQRAQSLTAAEEDGKNPTALAGHTSESMTRRYLRGRKSATVEGPNLRHPLDVGRKAQ
jgi:integrase